MKLLLSLLITLLSCHSSAESTLSYFNSFEENKQAFLEKSGRHILQSWYSQTDATLTTDLALYNFNSDQVLVISSGLHGIEGFVGSSVQRKLMGLLDSKKRLGYDVLFVHILNPWGMRHKRRVNEFNVDLNRNFTFEPKLFLEKNEDYLKINSFLNPTDQLNLNYFQRIQFFLKSFQLILFHSLESLRKSILLGQYTQNKGLFYGGHSLNSLQNKIDLLFQNDLSKYKKVIWIDLHTGYGARGQLHLLADASDLAQLKKLSAIFNHPIDSPDQKKFYKSKGDLTSYLNIKTNSEQDVTALVFEYGTLDSQKTFGSIESLRRMVIENQGYHFGYSDQQSEKQMQHLFENMFLPKEEDWKQSIYKQTLEVLNPFFNEVTQ